MLLAIDIGNTNIVLGLYQGKKLITHWRLATQAERTADEYGVIISELIDYSGHRSQQITAIAVSCVVPPMVTMTEELGQKFFHIDPLIVGPGVKTGMIMHGGSREAASRSIKLRCSRKTKSG